MDNKIKEIKQRLIEYKKHYNDPYAYYHGEIFEVRELLSNAPSDIEYLIAKIENKED